MSTYQDRLLIHPSAGVLLSADLAQHCLRLVIAHRYVATNGAHLLNGAITASTNGSAVITGSIVGNGMYLSAFYAHITPQYGELFSACEQVGPDKVSEPWYM